MFNQQTSVEKLKSEVERVFNDRFPLILNGGYEVIVENVRFVEPSSDLEAQTKAFINETTLSMPIKVDLIVKKDDEVLFERKQITFTNVPYPTERGSYIVNGNENVMINQMILRPGVYVKPTKVLAGKEILKAEVRANRTRFEIAFNKSDGSLNVEGLSLQFGQTPSRLPALPLLELLGVTEQELKEVINNNDVFELIKKNTKKSNAKEVFEKLFTEPYQEDTAPSYIDEQLRKRLAFDEKANKVSAAVIDHQSEYFDKHAFLATIRQMFKELSTPGVTPNVDDIRFKNIYGPEEIISRAIDEGINEWQKNLITAIRYNKVDKNSTHPAKAINKKVDGLYKSNLFEHVGSGNSLDLYQNQRKITFGGPGGIKLDSLSDSSRTLRDNSFTKIDPIETPQSLSLGYTQHLSKDVAIRNNTLYSSFYRVKDGVINRDAIVDDIDPVDEFNEVVAFHIPTQIDKTGTSWKLKGETIRARHQNEFVDVPVNQVTLIDKTSTSHFGHAAALVPFSAHNDGSRMLMGATMQRQALPLHDPDEPIVQSIENEDTQETTESRIANESSYLLKSPIDGKVTAIEDDFIELTSGDGKRVQVKKMNYHATGTSGGFINHNLVVSVGDEVKTGDLLADGWQSKNGKLALGKNTVIAYMPYKGYNFEDGVAVSESFSQKMASEELEILKEEIIYNEMTIPKRETKKHLQSLMVSEGVLKKLDSDGVIKKGQEIQRGDILIGIVRKKEKSHLSAAERILSRVILESTRDSFVNESIKVEGYQRGRVIDVEKVDMGDTMRVLIKVLTLKPMGIGDKLAGRHGNKATISAIIPDNEMPRAEDGQMVELIFSPLAVPSRKNLGQLLEANAGLVAKKKGLSSYNVQNFNSTERERLMKDLEEIGFPDGKMTLTDPITGKPYENPVTVGTAYIMKLKHESEGKIAGRNYIGAVDKVTDMPKKVSGATNGARNSPQSVGGMEFWSLTSAGAVHNIHEMTTIKSDGAGTDHDGSLKFKIYEALKEGRPLPEPATPQTVKVLQDQLIAAGVNMTPLKNSAAVTLDEQFNALMLSPIKHKDLEKLAPRTVQEAKTFNAYSKKYDKKGLYSEDVFGKNGDQWGKIESPTLLANPLYLQNQTSAKPYEALLSSKGISQKDIVNFVKNGHYIVLDEKESGYKRYQLLTPEEVDKAELEDDKEFVVATGPSALQKLLAGTDIKEEFTFNEQRVNTLNQKIEENKAQNKSSKTLLKERNDLLKHTKVLGTAIDNGMNATDYMLPFVPVLPVKYREPVQTGGNSLAEDGITLLYQRFMKQTEELNNVLEKHNHDLDLIDREVYANLEKARMETLDHIIGAGRAPYKDPSRDIEYKGIMHRLSSKEGFIRDKMQKKRQDYSGRSVIIGAPDLSLDEVRLPEDMAAEIFRPKIEGEMLRRKMSRDQISEAFKSRNEDFRTALSAVAEKEVVILNRAPSLHRHSLQGFKPQIGWNAGDRKNLAIGLNPLVTTGFNADFDGDTMAVHVPLTDAARKEVEEKLMPSKNLLNPTSNSMIMELKHEMILGLHYMTRDRLPEGGYRDFKNLNELKRAYDRGEISTYSGVRVDIPSKGMVMSTAGKVLFNSPLPVKYMDFDKNVNMRQKDVEAIILAIVEDSRYGPMRGAQVINEWKNIGFKAATKSALSIGVRDFDDVLKVDKDQLFSDAANVPEIAAFIDKRDEFETKKSEFVAKRVTEMIEKENLLDPNNPIEIMRVSGARAKAGQIQSMGVFVGHGKKIDESLIRPVKSSLLEGLTPYEFWDLANDSRKGIYDRSVATRDPGALTRQLWMSNKHTVITIKDCKDTKGIFLNMNIEYENKGLYGRVLLQDVPLKENKGVIRASGKPLTKSEIEQIRKYAETPTRINVRSPLSCKVKEGLCQLCYGLQPGTMTNELVPIGEAVGSIAAQAIGEPSQQAIMKTFHVGSGQNTVGSGFTMINDALMLKDTVNTAIVAKKDGVVTSVQKNPITGWTVFVDKAEYKLGDKPKHPDIIEGAKVSAGDSLTDLASTNLSTQDVLKYRGADAAKAHLTAQLETAFKAGGTDHIDRRHAELVVGNMTNHAVIESGATSNLLPGQQTSLKNVLHHNAQSEVDAPLTYANRINVIGTKAARDYSTMGGQKIVSKGEVITDSIWTKLQETRRKTVRVQAAPIQFTPTLSNVEQGQTKSTTNWLDSAAYNNVKKHITQGAIQHQVDQLNTPLTRQMTGLKGNFGEGITDFLKDMKERFSDFV